MVGKENDMTASIVYQVHTDSARPGSTCPSAIYSLRQQNVISYVKFGNKNLECFLPHAMLRPTKDNGKET
jgi:hypothetical protein